MYPSIDFNLLHGCITQLLLANYVIIILGYYYDTEIILAIASLYAQPSNSAMLSRT